MLKIQNLKKKYDKKMILDGLTLKVEKGDIYGFLGQNGAGKTTTLNCITKLIDYDQGDIQIDSNATINYLKESPLLYEYMTGREYLSYLYQLSHKKTSEKRIDELLESVGMLDHHNKKIKYYSRGMKQRLGIACTLINDPDFIMLDEPTSALDPQGRQDVIDIMKALNRQGKTILFSTHILSDVEAVCNRVGILHNHQLIKEGLLSEILSHQDMYQIEVENTEKALKYLNQHPDIEVIKSEGQMIVFSVIPSENTVFSTLSDIDTEIYEFKKHALTLQELFLKAVKS